MGSMHSCTITVGLCHNALGIYGVSTTSLVGPTVFRGKNLTNSAVNLVNSAAHRGKADEIPRLTAVTQLNFRGLIKS